MTDEERKKLCARLLDTSIPLEEIDEDVIRAALEIERLAEENETLRVKTVHNLRLTLNDKANEIERLVKRVAELEALPPDNARWAIHDNHGTFR